MIPATLTAGLATALAGILGLLLVASATLGTVIASHRMLGVPRWTATPPAVAELALRIRSWWIMAGAFAASLVLGRAASLLFLAVVSFLVLREYQTLVPVRAADRPCLFLVYCAVPLQYFLIGFGHGEAGPLALMIVFAAVSGVLALDGPPEGFLRSASTMMWGVLVAVVALGHLALLLAPARTGIGAVGGPALLLYLVFVVQLGDVAQYLAGKSFGCRRPVPLVSPNKTGAGFVGGLAATISASAALAPLLTPFGHGEAVLVGLALGALGCLGDLTVSALKRDLGVKDTGRLLPGHGGALDRVDSLVFAAPFFYYYLTAVH